MGKAKDIAKTLLDFNSKYDKCFRDVIIDRFGHLLNREEWSKLSNEEKRLTFAEVNRRLKV